MSKDAPPPERLPRFVTERLLLRQTNRHERLAAITGKLERDFGPGLGFWSAFAKRPPTRFLGWIVLITLDGNAEVEIGWRFARHAWGRGYATEAARAILAYGFQTLQLDPIVAVIAPGNRASMALAERLGLRRAGTRIAYGQELPFYRLDRADWLEPMPTLLTRKACQQGRLNLL